jgi:hypothetical protein
MVLLSRFAIFLKNSNINTSTVTKALKASVRRCSSRWPHQCLCLYALATSVAASPVSVLLLLVPLAVPICFLNLKYGITVSITPFRWTLTLTSSPSRAPVPVGALRHGRAEPRAGVPAAREGRPASDRVEGEDEHGQARVPSLRRHASRMVFASLSLSGSLFCIV